MQKNLGKRREFDSWKEKDRADSQRIKDIVHTMDRKMDESMQRDGIMLKEKVPNDLDLPEGRLCAEDKNDISTNMELVNNEDVVKPAGEGASDTDGQQ